MWKTLDASQKREFARYYINRRYKPDPNEITGTLEEKKKAMENLITFSVKTLNWLSNNQKGGYRKRKTHRKNHRKTRKSHFRNMKRY